MTLLIILTALLICLGIFMIVYAVSTDEMVGTLSFIGTLIFAFGVGFALHINFSSQPSAIDVYRGKTTLEITYRDNIPVDTVVVFKK